jgi:hypothetical protein
VREDWKEHLPRKPPSCTPFLKGNLTGDDDEQSICHRRQPNSCYRHNLAGPEGGPRSKMGSKDNRSGLANRPLRGRLRPGLAMYLDRCVFKIV